jgi:PAS domain-containing protein
MLDRRLGAQASNLARFQAIVESSHDAIVATELDGRIVAWRSWPGTRC